MLWSDLKNWPKDKRYPDAVFAAMNVERYGKEKEGDLEGWADSQGRFAEMYERKFEKSGDPAHLKSAEFYRESQRYFLRLLAWRRQGPDGPFR